MEKWDGDEKPHESATFIIDIFVWESKFLDFVNLNSIKYFLGERFKYLLNNLSSCLVDMPTRLASNEGETGSSIEFSIISKTVLPDSIW